MHALKRNAWHVQDLFPARLTCTSFWPYAVRGHLEEEGSKRIICDLRAPNCNAGARRASARGRRDRQTRSHSLVSYRQTTCNSLKNISLGGLAEKIHRVPLTSKSWGWSHKVAFSQATPRCRAGVGAQRLVSRQNAHLMAKWLGKKGWG